MRYNRHLSQLEAVYNVASPVGIVTEPVYVSDYIHSFLENQGTDPEWFQFFSGKHPEKALELISSKLCESGQLVNLKCIAEGIETFRKEI